MLNEVGDPNFGRRTAVPLDRISPYLLDATIATEDPNFYKHPGVDPVGLLRALYYAVKDRSLSGPGGSTITQQLVKLTFLTSEKSITRKVKEAILAAELTRRYPKDTILQIYLNEIYYGNLAYGSEAAAEPEGVFIARTRHVQALRRTREHLERARALAAQRDAALDLLAEELRLAHDALGAITGVFTADDLLGEIFGRFCIGK